MITSQADGHEQLEETLRARLAEAEEMLRAIRQGEIDALVVEGAGGNQVYTLHSAESRTATSSNRCRKAPSSSRRRGDILYANARFAALVGEPLESVVGSRIDRFVNASDRDDFETLLRAGSGRRRSRLIGSDSGAFEVSLSLTTTASASGDRLNLIVTDLSELLEANSNRDRAERDSRTKDEFLAMLAHELRNPLGAISSAVRVLELTRAEGEPATRAHEVIARQVGHISHLINDLLDVERVVSGKIRLDRQPLDMAEAVRPRRRHVHRRCPVGSAHRRQHRARVGRRGRRAARAGADQHRDQRGQVHAVRRPDSGGAPRRRQRRRAQRRGHRASASRRALLPFIFDMYVQADRTLDRAQGGLGIGLTLVRRLVELHGGTIAASSDGEGHGSRFTVRLKQIPAAAESAAVSFAPERRAKPRRVLLIEDNDDAREMLRMMLELAGHVVYDAADGVRGLELLDVVRPDVGIIDIGLPEMDGYQVARRIREEPHGRGMLLLALTGFGGTADGKTVGRRVRSSPGQARRPESACAPAQR